MKKNLLLNLSAILGLVLMYMAASGTPKTVQIEEIDERMVGEKVSVKGKVSNLSKAEDVIFFRIKNGSEELKAVSFRENQIIYDGLEVKASGRITIHRGSTELIANYIEKG